MPSYDFVAPRLAVGARPRPEEIAGLGAAGLGTVVDLRAENRDDPHALAAAGLGFLHLPTEDHHPPSLADLDRGVAATLARLDRGEGVLIHCEHGIGRSATLALCVMVARGAAPLGALRRAKAARPVISPSPRQFAGWCDWLDRHRDSRGADWAVPDFDAFAAIAYARSPEPAA